MWHPFFRPPHVVSYCVSTTFLSSVPFLFFPLSSLGYTPLISSPPLPLSLSIRCRPLPFFREEMVFPPAFPFRYFFRLCFFPLPGSPFDQRLLSQIKLPFSFRSLLSLIFVIPCFLPAVSCFPNSHRKLSPQTFPGSLEPRTISPFYSFNGLFTHIFFP